MSFKQAFHYRTKVCLTLSLLFHVVFFTLQFEKNLLAIKPQSRKLVEVSLVDAQKYLKKNRRNKVISLPRQIVNNELTGREEKTETRFLGKKNQRHDRQTIARQIGKFKEAGKGKRLGAKVKSKRVKPGQKRRSLKKISLKDLSYKATRFKEPIQAAASELEGIKYGQEGKRGLAQNNDFIEDIPLGDMTKLNTTEFKFYGFYHRIRQKLEQYWGNSLREKAKWLGSKGRRISSGANHITSLTIKLDSTGNIKRVIIDSTSGVKELDDAAVESFNNAGPFPNPPRGMLNAGGEAVIKWGFVVRS